MALAKRLMRVKAKCELAFEGFTEDLKTDITSASPVWLGTMRSVVVIRKLGTLDALVGVDNGLLKAKSLNRPKQNYAPMVANGHRRSPIIHFAGGIADRRFKAVGPNPFAGEALYHMPNFSEYYHVAGAL